jgi:hypothetical protein
MSGTLDINPLLKKYGQFSIVAGEEMKKVMTQEATLFVYNPGNIPGVINITPPFNARDNRPQSALFAARAAIDRDLAAVFQPVRLQGQRELNHFFGRRLRTPIKVPTKELWPNVAEIAAHRWKRKNEERRKVMGRGRKQAYYVDFSKLEVVRRESYALIGLACACWYQAAMQAGLEPRGVPAWIKRHTSAFGAGTIEVTATSIKITLSSSLPYNAALSMQERASRVLGYREAALDRRLPYVLAAAARKAKLAA